MPDTVITVSNTPIFDQLVAKRGYDPKFPEHLTRASDAFVEAGKWITKPVPVINPKISETFDPAALEDQAINPQLHIQQIVKKFTAKWPNVVPVHITRLDNIDGTITIVVSKAEMLEQTDESVNADPSNAVVKPLSEVSPTSIPETITTARVDFEKESTYSGKVVQTGWEALQKRIADSLKDEMVIDQSTIDPIPAPDTEGNFGNLLSDFVQEQYTAFRREHPYGIIQDVKYKPQDDGSIKYIVSGVEPKSIGEDTADALYMRPSAWGSDEE